MATQLVPLEWADLPSTIDEQANILRTALKMRGRDRLNLDAELYIDRWEADLLVNEAQKAGPVAREALVLLQARAAEWASQKSRNDEANRGRYAALLGWALTSWGEVQRSFKSEPKSAVTEIETRLADLQDEFTPKVQELAKVVAWPEPDSAATSVIDRDSLPDLGVIDPEPENVDVDATVCIPKDFLRVEEGESIFDQAAVRSGFEPIGSDAPVASNHGATSVMDRDEILGQVAELEASAPLDDHASTSVMDRDEILAQVAELDATSDVVSFDDFTETETETETEVVAEVATVEDSFDDATLDDLDASFDFAAEALVETPAPVAVEAKPEPVVAATPKPEPTPAPVAVAKPTPVPKPVNDIVVAPTDRSRSGSSRFLLVAVGTGGVIAATLAAVLFLL